MSRLIISHGDFEGPQFAHILGWLAGYVDGDEATSYTNDDVIEKAVLLREALDRKIAAATVVRGTRKPRPTGGTIKL